MCFSNARYVSAEYINIKFLDFVAFLRTPCAIRRKHRDIHVTVFLNWPEVLLSNFTDAVPRATASEDVFCGGRCGYSRKTKKKVHVVPLRRPPRVFRMRGTGVSNFWISLRFCGHPVRYEGSIAFTGPITVQRRF